MLEFKDNKMFEWIKELFRSIKCSYEITDMCDYQPKENNTMGNFEVLSTLEFEDGQYLDISILAPDGSVYRGILTNMGQTPEKDIFLAGFNRGLQEK